MLSTLSKMMLISPLIVSQTALTLLSFDISPLAHYYSSIRGAHAIKTLRRAGIGIGPLSDGVCRHYVSAEQNELFRLVVLIGHNCGPPWQSRSAWKEAR